MTKQEFQAWRDGEVKRVGLKTQLAAEAKLEREKSMERVRVADDATGEVKEVRADVAEALTRRGGRVSYARKRSYFYSK